MSYAQRYVQFHLPVHFLNGVMRSIRHLAQAFFPLILICGCNGSSESAKPATSIEKQAPSEKLFTIDLGETSTNPSVPEPATNRKPTGSDQLSTRFRNAAESSQLNFVYQTGAQGKSLMVETMGGGCGAIDFDADGCWEIFVCQGGDPTASANDVSQPRDHLFRKVQTALSSAAFANVSPYALPQSPSAYSQGVSIGDFDDDGFDDIYITNVGGNQLLRNMGDGTFQDVSQTSATNDQRWSSSSAFADLNGDGLLDLYVCNYVMYDPLNPIDCRNDKGEYRICHPREMDPVPDACFINQGDGTFHDEAAPRGLTGEGSKALGVAVADFNLDGLPDLYVANDTTANFYFVNQGDGTFKDQALLLGCAMDRTGAYQASMGLGVGDFNDDGLLDIYSSHFYDDSNTLYQNLGPAGFQDVTAKVGLHEPTLEKLGFGAIIEDFNLDGFQEIFVTNGHIENYPDNKLHQMTAQLFAFNGSNFIETSQQAGDYFQQKFVGRGVCQADFDEDGDLDVVVVNQDQPLALLENLTRNDSDIAGGSMTAHFISLQFQGVSSNRRGIGCKVTLTNGTERFTQELIGGGSYASSRQPLLCFGVRDVDQAVTLEVTWPGGAKQVFENVAVDQQYFIHEDRGLSVKPSP